MLTEEAVRTLVAAIGVKLREAADGPEVDFGIAGRAAEAMHALRTVLNFVSEPAKDGVRWQALASSLAAKVQK